MGEKQPLAVADGRYRLALDGRLDNRQELLEALGELPAARGSRAPTDAELVAAAFRRWGGQAFGRLLGPFAVAILDRRRGSLVCARDPLGGRSLFYSWNGRTFLAASEEQALLRHPEVSSALDDETVARFFGLLAPRSGATFFADVRELPPGSTLTLDDGRLELHRYWRPDPGERLCYAADADYAAHFRQLLTDSVTCRMRSASPPSVLMSGGLDSTSVAALAAAALESRGGARLRTFSWVFDELAEQDERRYMDPVIARYRLDAFRLPGDGAWPLRDLETWRVNPNAPVRDLYRLREMAYDASSRAGCRVMLTGDFGDNLFIGYDFWLRDLLAEGRLAEAAREILDFLSGRPVPNVDKPKRLRKALTRALGWRGRRPRAPRWLTRSARELLAGGVEPVPEAPAARRPDQFRTVLDPVNAHGANLEQGTANRLGVELRYPFRDRRLIQFVLAIPAHQLYRPGWLKWLLRQAMRDVLPESVRLRRRPTSLLPLCARGLIERESGPVAALLAAPDAIWPRYVRSDWLSEGFPRLLGDGVLSLETVVAWRCLCMELWAARHRAPVSEKAPSTAFQPERRHDS